MLCFFTNDIYNDITNKDESVHRYAVRGKERERQKDETKIGHKKMTEKVDRKRGPSVSSHQSL